MKIIQWWSFRANFIDFINAHRIIGSVMWLINSRSDFLLILTLFIALVKSSNQIVNELIEDVRACVR
jgi:hypothetical protein